MTNNVVDTRAQSSAALPNDARSLDGFSFENAVKEAKMRGGEGHAGGVEALANASPGSSALAQDWTAEDERDWLATANGIMGAFSGGGEILSGSVTSAAGAGVVIFGYLTSKFGGRVFIPIGYGVAGAGLGIITHGTDTLQAGLRSVIFGKPIQTLTAEWIEQRVESPTAAGIADGFIGIGGAAFAGLFAKLGLMSAALIPREVAEWKLANQAAIAAQNNLTRQAGGLFSGTGPAMRASQDAERAIKNFMEAQETMSQAASSQRGLYDIVIKSAAISGIAHTGEMISESVLVESEPLPQNVEQSNPE